MTDTVPITPGAGVSISSDEITTLNGVTVPTQQMQRNKTCFGTGVDGEAKDATRASGLPVDPGTVTNTPYGVLVSGTPVLLIAANANRRSLLIQDQDEGFDLWIKYGTGAGLTADYNFCKIRRGGNRSWEGLNVPTAAIYGISNGTNVGIHIEEGV